MRSIEPCIGQLTLGRTAFASHSIKTQWALSPTTEAILRTCIANCIVSTLNYPLYDTWRLRQVQPYHSFLSASSTHNICPPKMARFTVKWTEPNSVDWTRLCPISLVFVIPSVRYFRHLCCMSDARLFEQQGTDRPSVSCIERESHTFQARLTLIHTEVRISPAPSGCGDKPMYANILLIPTAL